MFTMQRSTVRKLKNAFRSAGIYDGRSKRHDFAFMIDAHSNGITALAMSLTSGATVRCHERGSFAAERVIVPRQFLDDCEGNKGEVTLTGHEDGSVTAQWQDGVVPQIQVYPAWKKGGYITTPDEMPETACAVGPEFLAAMVDAAECTDDSSIRYALACVQLRGGGYGDIVATDGRQLLKQWGFQFPWSEALLFCPFKVFSCPELPRKQPVTIGRTKKHFVLEANGLTFWLPLELEKRFPKIDDIIGKPNCAANNCTFAPADARFALDALKRLPEDEDNRGVTVDLNGHVLLRSWTAQGNRTTEIALSESKQIGASARYHIGREYLSRAFRLGFDNLAFFGGENSPIQADDARRTYLFMRLASKCAFKEADDAVLIESKPGSVKPAVKPQPVAEPQPQPVAEPQPVAKPEPGEVPAIAF